MNFIWRRNLTVLLVILILKGYQEMNGGTFISKPMEIHLISLQSLCLKGRRKVRFVVNYCIICILCQQYDHGGNDGCARIEWSISNHLIYVYILQSVIFVLWDEIKIKVNPMDKFPIKIIVYLILSRMDFKVFLIEVILCVRSNQISGRKNMNWFAMNACQRWELRLLMHTPHSRQVNVI